MSMLRWICLAVLCFLLLEGFILSVFPNQFKQMMSEAEPGALQFAGIVETLLAVALISAVLYGS